MTAWMRWPRHNDRGQAGLTLLEILVALAIAAVALAAIYGFVLSTTRSFGLAENVIEAQQTVRFIADRISEEARWAEGVAPDGRCAPTLLCSDRVTLRIPGSNPIKPGMSYEVTFAYDRGAATAIRRHERTEQPLGERVSVLQFRYLTANGEPAAQPEAVARIGLVVTARRSDREPERTIQTDFLLRNLRDVNAEPVAAPPPPPPAFRPAPSPPPGLGPIAPGAPPRAGGPPPAPSQPGAPAEAPPPVAQPGQPVCPAAPEALRRRPPPRPDIRGALVEVSGWEIVRAPNGALLVSGDVDNQHAHPVSSVRVSATGYGTGGNIVASGSASVGEIAEHDFETFQITLPPGTPILWVMLKVEQYLPRPTAPLHAALAEVDLEIYREVAKERVSVSAVVVPPGPASRQIACVTIADPGGLPVLSARVNVEVAAVGQRTITQIVEVSAGKSVSFPLTWSARVIPGVTNRVEEVRLAP